jgi:hypothetical protein
MLPAVLKAEALFLKNGSILEGKIAKDTDREVVITINNKPRTVPRKDILRVLYNDEYKSQVYFFMTDNSIIEGHLVDETRDSYTYRTKLSSAAEKTVSKDAVRFVSKEKISVYEMQKKAEKPKLIADRKDKFANLMGLRLGSMYTLSRNSGVGHDDGDDVLMNFGLYYIDRFFEFNWDMYFGFGDKSAMLHQYVMTFLPFSTLKVELGINIGYLNFSFYKLESDSENNYGSSLDYNGFLVGLSYRWGGWFRLGFFYSIGLGIDADYTYQEAAIWYKASYHDPKLGFNCHAFVEVFVWTNLSIRASYWLLGGDLRAEKDDSAMVTPRPDRITLFNHCVSLSIGYGLNLF